MLEAIIFDMDGVIIDSERIHMKANEMTMEALGLKFEKEYYLQFVGSTTAHMWKTMIHDFDIKKSIVELDAISTESIKKILKGKGYPEVPGVTGLIKRLKDAGVRMAIASSSGIDRIKRVISDLSIEDMFEVLVTGDQVKKPKPAPDTFLAAAELLNVAKKNCLVIEDSTNGIRAAKAAGMTCVAYEIDDDILRQDNNEADYVIQGFDELDIDFFEMIYAHSNKEP